MTRKKQKENPDSAHSSGPDAAELAKNLARAAEHCQTIMQEFLARNSKNIGNIPFDPLNIGNAFMEMFAHMMSDPVKLWEKQIGLWQDYMSLLQTTTQKLLGEDQKPVIEPDSR